METTFHAPTPDIRDGLRMAKPQKAFAVAFAVLTAALAGCASGLGAKIDTPASFAQVEEGTIIGNAAGRTGFAYTIRLPSGELVQLAQAGDYAIPSGTPVLIEYGANARVVPQQLSQAL